MVGRTGSRVSVAALLTLTAAMTGCAGGEGPCGNGPGIDNLIAHTERWVRVVVLTTAPEEEGTRATGYRVIAIGGNHAEGTTHAETIATHSVFIPGIREGLAHDADIYLGLNHNGLERELVSFVVVRDAEGGHHFPGDRCLAEDEQLLRDRLGGRYDRRIDAVIGLTDVHRALELLDAAS